MSKNRTDGLVNNVRGDVDGDLVNNLSVSKAGKKTRKKYALIACSKSKFNMDNVYPERLYAKSTLNRLSTEYCKLHNIEYFYISAKYKLVSNKSLISNYDTTLYTFSKEEIKNWSKDVFDNILSEIPLGSDLYILAGETYYKYMLKDLRSSYNVILLFSGLKGIGYILSFLKRETLKKTKTEKEEVLF